MQSTETALFIGRFQPFHLGHLDAVRQIFADNIEFLIIGIGSAEQNLTPDNPFTAGERFTIIRQSLIAAGIDPALFTIVPVRNINNYALWPRHTELLVPEFSRVYSGSPLVRHLFEQYSNKQVVALNDTTGISATLVRQSILDQDDLWQRMVPLPAKEWLITNAAAKRLANIGDTAISKISE